MEPVVSRLDLEFHAHRNPIIGMHNQLRPGELCWRNANDGERIAVDFDLPSNYARIHREAALPKTVTDDHDGMSTGLIIFLGSEKTAQHRMNAEHLKIVTGGLIAPNA